MKLPNTLIECLNQLIEWRKRIAVVFGLMGVLLCFYGLVPEVSRLKKGTIDVVRWKKPSGKESLTVGSEIPGWIGLNQISLHLVHAILVAEDARFYDHIGVDFHEIWVSFLTNIEHGKIVRGASTITQQLVKITLLHRKKTFLRKIREIFGAIILEQSISKEKILTWYLNLIEFGDGVCGINEASYHYFKTRPELLTIVQAVHLALVLPSPNRFSKGLRQKRLTEFGHSRFYMILTKMLSAGYITEGQLQQAMATGNFGSPIVRSST